jgi:hypothetical protein
VRFTMRSVSPLIPRLLAFVAVVALCCSAVLAQQTLGGITGEVSDSSGGVIPNATVTVVDENDGAHALGQDQRIGRLTRL